MAEPNGASEKGSTLEESKEEVSMYSVLRRLILNPNWADSTTPLLQRIKISFSENVPLLPEASRNTGHHVLLWTRHGTHLRSLLVVSVGMVTLLALTGLILFMLFFVGATFNAIVISLLMSLAAAGGFMAIFFACLTAIYIGALSVAVFVISTITISAIVAALIVTGWVGFFWTIWILTKKSMGIATHSLNMTASALSAFSSARHRQERGKVSD